MEPRFRAVTRDQQFLLPPDVREWLPAGHAALFLVEVVERLDLSRFIAAYRSTADRGRPAYHPRVMVGICQYASMCGVTSSRQIERLLAVDVGFRVVAANERPDHGTISRFLIRHAEALEDVFDQVVGLAAEAGLVDPTLVALDGTKMAADASKDANERLGEVRKRFADWAAEVAENDAADDAAEAAGTVVTPIPEMATNESMTEWIKRRLREKAEEADEKRLNMTDPDSGLLPRSGGGWVQGYNAQAAAVAGGIVVAADVTATPVDSKVLAAMIRLIGAAVRAATRTDPGVVVADAGYWDEATIAEVGEDDVLIATGRAQPTAAPDPLPETATDPAWEEWMAARERERQLRIEIIAGVVARQLLLREAAQLLGLSIARIGELKQAWIAADGPDGIPLPNNVAGRVKRPQPPTAAARARHAMDTRLASPAGRSMYRQRQAIIEPVFGDIKTNRRILRFRRRGTPKVRMEWKWILTGHNLTLLHQRT